SHSLNRSAANRHVQTKPQRGNCHSARIDNPEDLVLRYGIIELTQGNLNNEDLYLTTIMGLFPSNSVGGSPEAERAAQLLEIHSGIGDPVLTDIAGDKKIFRKRAWVG